MQYKPKVSTAAGLYNNRGLLPLSHRQPRPASGCTPKVCAIVAGVLVTVAVIAAAIILGVIFGRLCLLFGYLVGLPSAYNVYFSIIKYLCLTSAYRLMFTFYNVIFFCPNYEHFHWLSFVVTLPAQLLRSNYCDVKLGLIEKSFITK